MRRGGEQVSKSMARALAKGLCGGQEKSRYLTGGSRMNEGEGGVHIITKAKRDRSGRKVWEDHDEDAPLS